MVARQDIDSKRTELETNILIEKQWRESIQRDLQHEHEQAAQVEPLKEQMRQMEDDLAELREQYDALQRDYAEQEQTLVDLGAHVSESKLRLNDIEAKEKIAKAKGWADDRAVTECQGCNKVFNVTRRFVSFMTQCRLFGILALCLPLPLLFPANSRVRFALENTIVGGAVAFTATCARITRCRSHRLPSQCGFATAAKMSCYALCIDPIVMYYKVGHQ